MPRIEPLESALLPPGIRSRHLEAVNGLTMHVLEAGFEGGDRPGMILLHGFPELAYSWRKIMLPLAAAGHHVVAPDQRGYGRTVGWNAGGTADLSAFRLLNLVRDVVGLLHALGWRSAAISGHDFGSPVAAWCALLRPDLFHAVALMSSPFSGAPPLPSRGAGDSSSASANIHDELARLERPRKHYQWYYSSPPANTDMLNAPQGLHAFLRAYFHVKSGDWPGNRPFPLRSWSASELAKLPTYYTMELNQSMPATVAPHMPTAEQISACRWLTDDELGVYTMNSRAPDSSVAFSGTGARRALPSTASFRYSPAAPLTCRRSISPANTIGAPINFLATSSKCSPGPVAGFWGQR